MAYFVHIFKPSKTLTINAHQMCDNFYNLKFKGLLKVKTCTDITTPWAFIKFY